MKNLTGNDFYQNLERLLKVAGKNKAAINLVETLYNSGASSVVITKLSEIDAACRLERDFPDAFYCQRKDYSNDHVFGLKGVSV